MRLFLLMLVLLGCVPATASAVTIDEVVALAKSGVSEQVVVAVIERDQTLFTLSPALIMKLQRDGLSDRILLALIKSGRPNEPLPASPVVRATAESRSWSLSRRSTPTRAVVRVSSLSSTSSAPRIRCCAWSGWRAARLLFRRR